MPIRYSIHPERRLALFRFEGNVDAKDCADVFLDYIADKSFEPSLTMLSDTSELVSVHASFRGILTRLLAMHRALAAFPDPALSIIFARTDRIYGMARMLEQTLTPLSRIKMVVTKNEKHALHLAGQPEQNIGGLIRALETYDHEVPGNFE